MDPALYVMYRADMHEPDVRRRRVTALEPEEGLARAQQYMDQHATLVKRLGADSAARVQN